MSISLHFRRLPTQGLLPAHGQLRTQTEVISDDDYAEDDYEEDSDAGDDDSDAEDDYAEEGDLAMTSHLDPKLSPYFANDAGDDDDGDLIYDDSYPVGAGLIG